VQHSSAGTQLSHPTLQQSALEIGIKPVSFFALAAVYHL